MLTIYRTVARKASQGVSLDFPISLTTFQYADHVLVVASGPAGPSG